MKLTPATRYSNQTLTTILIACVAVAGIGCPMRDDFTSNRRAAKKRTQELKSSSADCMEWSRKPIGDSAYLRDATIFDVDADGRTELVIPKGFQPSVQILDLKGNSLETVQFEVSWEGLLREVQPLSIRGKTHWLAIRQEWLHEKNTMRDQPVATLLNRDGKRLWTYRPSMPADEDGEIVAASGQLRDRMHDEIVLAINMRPSFNPEKAEEIKDAKSAALSLTERVHGHLVFLDAADGSILCQMPLETKIEILRVVPSDNPDELDRLVVGFGSTLMLFKLPPAPKNQLESQPAIQPAASRPH